MSNLWVGIGYQQGVPAIAMARSITQVLIDFQLDVALIAGVGTIDRKVTDLELRQICQHHGWPIQYFSAAELKLLPVPQPSLRVQRRVSTPTVAEGAALLAAGRSSQLLITKQIYGQAGQAITIAVAQMADPDKISCC